MASQSTVLSSTYYMRTANDMTSSDKIKYVSELVSAAVQAGASKESIIDIYKTNNMNVPAWINDYTPAKRTTCIDSSRSNSSVQISVANKPPTSNITSSPRITYKAKINIQYTPDNGITIINIPSEQISYLLHEYLYDDVQMPGIVLSLCVSDSLYTTILDNRSTGLFRVTITIVPIETANIVQRVILDKLFTYTASSDNPNYAQTMSDSDEYFNDAYKTLVVGLTDPELDNLGRITYNGIKNNIDTTTILGNAIENTRMPIIELPKYNDMFETFIVPPLTTRYQLIQYLYDKKAFYDTRFRFFMDYDKTYLLSRNGNAISTGEGIPENIIIDIKALTSDEIMLDGMEIRDGSYYIYVNPAMSNIIQQQSVEKVANQLITVSDDGTTNTTNLVINATINNDIKPIYIRDDDATVYQNLLEEDTLGIQIVKQNIDPTIFTINKSITVNNFGKYAGYNGQYLISSRRDLYKNMAGEFTISSVLILRKIGTIVPSRNLESAPVQTFAPGSTSSAGEINPSSKSTAQTSSRSASSQEQAKNTVNSQQTNTSRQGSIDANKQRAIGATGAIMVSNFNSANNKQSSAQVTSTANQRNRNSTQTASRALTVSISPSMAKAAAGRL